MSNLTTFEAQLYFYTHSLSIVRLGWVSLLFAFACQRRLYEALLRKIIRIRMHWIVFMKSVSAAMRDAGVWIIS